MMNRVIRVSISFDYYPDEDELVLEDNLTEDDLIEYYKDLYVDDIYSFVKYNELREAIDVEVINV
jgi:hypothetical protein